LKHPASSVVFSRPHVTTYLHCDDSVSRRGNIDDVKAIIDICESGAYCCSIDHLSYAVKIDRLNNFATFTPPESLPVPSAHHTIIRHVT
jgi:hypothetical protein